MSSLMTAPVHRSEHVAVDVIDRVAGHRPAPVHNCVVDPFLSDVGHDDVRPGHEVAGTDSCRLPRPCRDAAAGQLIVAVHVAGDA